MPGPVRRRRNRPAVDNHGVGGEAEVNSRSRKFVFTHNNWEQEDRERWEEFANRDGIVWFIMQPEIGEDGTPHLQGAFVCETRKRYSTIHAEVGASNYALFVMQGTEWEAYHYCEKAVEGCDCEKCVAARGGPQVDPEVYFLFKVGEEPAHTTTSSKTRKILDDIERYDCGCSPFEDVKAYMYDHFIWDSDGHHIFRTLCPKQRALLMCSPLTLSDALHCFEELSSSDDTA